ncbi:Protein of unknown function [Bacillus wiedmannii]|uniref:Uncharacterized protein n=1 Tax=Bacillus wiedmannii TaxID=1890302 RepID=A0A1C4EW96_9BACI|nr:Protein of unknown function [Bacillus wiedmannii]
MYRLDLQYFEEMDLRKVLGLFLLDR